MLPLYSEHRHYISIGCHASILNLVVKEMHMIINISWLNHRGLVCTTGLDAKQSLSENRIYFTSGRVEMKCIIGKQL